MLIKQYKSSLAEIGDTIVALYNPFYFGEWIPDHEYVVKKVEHGYVVAHSNNLPSQNNEITIPNNYYEVIELVEEKEMNTFKRFLIEWLPIWFPLSCVILLISFL